MIDRHNGNTYRKENKERIKEKDKGMENYINVKIKRENEDVKLPKYAKPGDFGMDLTCTSIVYNSEYDFYEFHTGVYCEFPKGVGAYLLPRSSNRKTDAYLCNSCGLIDEGYRGELIFCYKNRTSYEVQCMLDEWERLKTESYDKMFEEDARMIISSIHEEPDPMDFCPFKVGDRIGQMVIFETKRAELTEVDELTDSERGSGGFGHTGN